MNILDTIWQYILDSGIGHFHWSNGVMIGVGLLFIYLAVKKRFEPLLLVPIGFGILIGNIPYDSSKLPLSVYDGPVSEDDLSYYEIDISRAMFDGEWVGPGAARELVRQDGESAYELTMRVLRSSERVEFARLEPITSKLTAMTAMERGHGIMVNEHSVLSARHEITEPGIYSFGQGRQLFVAHVNKEERYPELWSIEKQDPHNASVLWWLFAGVGVAGFYPPLIFLGIGALTDFGPMLSNPKTLLLGAAAQFGIFGSLLGAIALGFGIEEAASIGIIGGADGPTAIFTCSRLAPELLGAVALAAYSYMALVPIIQPPIIRLLTTSSERKIRMVERNPASRRVKIVFPIVGFLLTAMLAPGGLPLLGMLFFGNLLRESTVTDRLSKTAQTTFIDIVTILLGVTVGAKTSAPNFLTMQTIYIFGLGIAAFSVATATGVIFAKIMNRVSKDPVNPMIGAAGVSAVPMAARVVHRLGQEEDPQNFLLMHAMGPNVAGVIGSAVAGGVLLSTLIK